MGLRYQLHGRILKINEGILSTQRGIFDKIQTKSRSNSPTAFKLEKSHLMTDNMKGLKYYSSFFLGIAYRNKNIERFYF